MQLLSRQPVEGRSRGGGLRVGEMERDCILSHGASSVLLDRLFHQSDEFSCSVCRHCGLVAESMAPTATVRVEPAEFCRGCCLGGPEHIAQVSLPYSAALRNKRERGWTQCRVDEAQHPEAVTSLRCHLFCRHEAARISASFVLATKNRCLRMHVCVVGCFGARRGLFSAPCVGLAKSSLDSESPCVLCLLLLLGESKGARPKHGGRTPLALRGRPSSSPSRRARRRPRSSAAPLPL